MSKEDQSKMLGRHLALLKQLEGRKVEAGWFDTNTYADGKKVAYIAQLLEFGFTRVIYSSKGPSVQVVPPRPFMRKASDDFKTERSAIEQRVTKRLFSGKIDVNMALNQVGMAMEGLIVKSVKEGGWTPNAKQTIYNKGFDWPLVHDGTMWQTVTSKVY